MIYFDSDMYKRTNTVVYFDWKAVINNYVCGKCRTQFMLPMEKSVTFTGGKCRTQFMLPMEKSVTFTGACANEIIPNGQLARLLTKRKK